MDAEETDSQEGAGARTRLGGIRARQEDLQQQRQCGW